MEELGGDLGVDVRRLLAVLWRRKWLIVAVVVLFSVGAGLAGGDGSVTGHKSVAEVLVKPITANPLERPARVDQAVDLETEGGILSSSAVAELAGAKMGTTEAVEELTDRVSTSVSPDTQILRVAYRGETPEEARAGAQAFAEAYLEYKSKEALDAVTKITDGIQARLGGLEAQLKDANTALAANLPGTAGYIQAETSRDVATSQIALLRNQIASYTAIDVDPGAIIRPAATSEPIRSQKLPVPLAAVAGLLVGVAVAFVRDRFDDRFHEAAAPASLIGAPLLAGIPRRRRAERRQILALPPGPEAEAYQRLASNLMAAAKLTGVRTIVVTSAMPHEGKTTVAANVAAALARSTRTAVVSADLRLPTLQRFFPGATGPTVNDILEGRADPGAAGVVVGHPDLSVYVSTPAEGHPGHLVQSEAMRAFLDRLSRTHDFVIIDAAPVLPVADTLPLAARADATIIVTRHENTTQTQLGHAHQQLVQIGAKVLGTVTTQTPARAEGRHGYYSYHSSSTEPKARWGRAVPAIRGLRSEPGAAAWTDRPERGANLDAGTGTPEPMSVNGFAERLREL
ncbi:MAG TPA: hypothetical protein VI854_01760 [Acidimicrobiia bacterium]|nr:hypothetical protein [Acidimicrobiia bacterium]